MANTKREKLGINDIFRRPNNLKNEKPSDSKALIKRLLRYIGKNKILLAGIIFMVVVISILSAIKPILLGLIIDLLTLVGDDASINFNRLYYLLTLLLLGTISNSIAQYIQSYLAAHFTKKNILNLRKDAFNAISLLPIAYMDSHSHGDMMSRLANDTDNIAQVLSQTMGTFISSIVSIVSLTAVMLYFSPLLTFIVYLFVPFSILSTRILSKKMRVYFREKHASLGKLEESISENVYGYETLLAYNQRHKAKEEFNAYNNEYKGYAIKAGILSSLINPIMGLTAGLAYLIVVFVGAILAIKGTITIGTIQVFLLYVRQITQPLNNLTSLYAQIQTALAGAERVFALLDEAKEKDDGTKEFAKQEGEMFGDIFIDNISFGYSQEKNVLEDFSLHIKAGQKIAIVGETGSGKTSLINLLMRFYSIKSGKITLDGINIENYSLKSLRKHIALVPQETFLFSESIGYNIEYGKTGTLSHNKEEMIQAAKSANAHNFIMQLPHKYDTILSSEGKNLSIGQKQLLALARTFIMDAPILIMDEATANVDTLTEMQIQDAMFKLMKNKTCIVIAHRLSTIIRMDTIVVLDKGKLVEYGNHEELLRKKGTYYNLYMHQV